MLKMPGEKRASEEEEAERAAREERKRQRKSRWGEENNTRTCIPGMPTILPQTMSDEQQRIYLLQIQIEDISRKLRTGDLGIPTNPEERSPSPEPIYDGAGKRLNTRDYRMRKKHEDARHDLITQMMKINPVYKPPADYKIPMARVTDKVWIPQEEHPDINFVGLLIGPRGHTLKNLEKESGAKIIIRGKGSVKEGKIGGRKDGVPMPGEDEPLHAYITGPTAEVVTSALDRIREIIRKGIELPEGQNDLRRQQLRELALLNGTLRENDGLNKLRMLAEAQTVITNQIVCSICGGAGHISNDCKLRSSEPRTVTTVVQQEKMDSEYLSLMAELGEVAPSFTKPTHLLSSLPSLVRPGLPHGPPRASLSMGSSSNWNSPGPSSNWNNQVQPLMSAPPPPPPPPPQQSQQYQPAWAGGQQNNYMSPPPPPPPPNRPQMQQQWQDYSWNAAPQNPYSNYSPMPIPPPPPPPPPS